MYSVKAALDRIDRIFEEIRILTGVSRSSLRKDSNAFLRGRDPVLMECQDGVIRAVRPGMNAEEIGTNVIPLPRKE